jgi:hypothetical protein
VPDDTALGFANRPDHVRARAYRPTQKHGRACVAGPIRAVVDLAVEPLSDTGSRLTITIDFEGRGIGKILVPLLVRRDARTETPSNLHTVVIAMITDQKIGLERLESEIGCGAAWDVLGVHV